MAQKNGVVATTTGPENLLDRFVTYQYRYWLCIRNVTSGAQELNNKLTTGYSTTPKEPTCIDENTYLLYHSVSDTHLYIDNLDYTTIYYGAAGARMQPVSDIVMSIKEPYGCFFIEKIEKTFKYLGVSTWASAQFFVKIDFVGTLPNGKIEQQEGVYFHFIPGANIGVSVNNMAGTEYTFSGTITDYCPGVGGSDADYSVFKRDAITVKGDKVQTVLNDLQDKLNRIYATALKNLGNVGKPVRYVFDAGDFGDYDISVNSANQVRNAGQGDTQKDGGDAKNIGQMLVCKPGTTIASFINDKVLMNSKQYIAQLSSNRDKVGKMDQTGLFVAKIVYSQEVTPTELVMTYKLVKVDGQNFSTIIENDNSKSTQQKTLADLQAEKENRQGKFNPNDCYVFQFHYTFGTENTSVENFEMRAENVIGYINADHVGTADDSMNLSSKSQSRFKNNVFNEDDSQQETAKERQPYVPNIKNNDTVRLSQTMSIANSSLHNNDAAMAGVKKDAQSSLTRYSAAAGLVLNAQIRGHLSLLRIDKFMKEKEKENQNSTAILAKFEVRNIDGDLFWNDGYYFIQTVGNKFQGGKFKQTLSGFYLDGQPSAKQ